MGELLGSMLGIHLLIGLGEAAITVGVAAIVANAGSPAGASTARVWGAAVGSATLLSLVASSQPDGLERVGDELGFALGGPGSILAASPLADYQVGALGGRPSVALAGLAGVIATCALCAALSSVAGAERAGRQSSAWAVRS